MYFIGNGYICIVRQGLRVVPAGVDTGVVASAHITGKGVADDDDAALIGYADFLKASVEEQLIWFRGTEFFGDKDIFHNAVESGKRELVLLCRRYAVCYDKLAVVVF